MNSDSLGDFTIYETKTKMIDSAIKREFSSSSSSSIGGSLQQRNELVEGEPGGGNHHQEEEDELVGTNDNNITNIINKTDADNNDDEHDDDEATNDATNNGTSANSSGVIADCVSLSCNDDEDFLNQDSSDQDYHSEFNYSSSSTTNGNNNNTNNNTSNNKQNESGVESSSKLLNTDERRPQGNHHHQNSSISSNNNNNHASPSSAISSNNNNNNHSDEPEQMRKLFIGGLDYKTSESTLKQHFEKFGDVIDCVVMREPQSKRSRGFGFVIYANSLMVDRAQDARPHEIDGREVQSKRAISREDSGKPEAQATVKKVYLGGLSDDIEESELKDYFRNFGNILNVNIVAHKDTGKRRGFAFVEYDDYDPVDKIVLKKFHTIKDKRIEAKKAIPKVEMDARKRVDQRGLGGMVGGGGGVGGGQMMGQMNGPLDGVSGNGHPGGRPPRSSRNGGGAGACLWDSGPYGDYPGAGLDGYSAAPQYHYGAAANWMMHGGGGGGGQVGVGSSYGFSSRGPYARSSYSNQASNWTAAINDYGGGLGPAAHQGGPGPMRLSYQHRSWGPYGTGYGAHRGRGYNP